MDSKSFFPISIEFIISPVHAKPLWRTGDLINHNHSQVLDECMWVGPVITGLELIHRKDNLEKDIAIYVRETVMKPASVGSMVGAVGGRKDITHRETRSV